MKKDMHSPFEVLISVGATLGWEVRFSNPPGIRGGCCFNLRWSDVGVGRTPTVIAYIRNNECFNLRWSDVGVGSVFSTPFPVPAPLF